jgi:hypothetical protein
MARERLVPPPVRENQLIGAVMPPSNLSLSVLTAKAGTRVAWAGCVP